MKSKMKNLKQKMIIVLVALLLFNFTVPPVSNAGVANLIIDPVKNLLLVIVDAFNYIIDMSLLGANNSAVETSWEEREIEVESGSNRVFDDNEVKIPRISVSPDEIFLGQIPLLNANFFRDTETETSQDDQNSSWIKQKVTKALSKFSDDNDIKSSLEKLRITIASWYKGLRNIAIIGLMCVLVYVAIRMILSATANDKAKYKKMLSDWIVALCLIFFMHYIMAFAMNLSETMVYFFAGDEDSSIGLMGTDANNHDKIKSDENSNPLPNYVVDDSHVHNFLEFTRIYAQLEDFTHAFTYLIIYIVLTCYTIYFAFIYLKRFLYLAFLTMIAPLVSLTYPLDKIQDGQAQAFNMWLKEYMYNALLQPFHALIYRVFVLMALEMAGKSLLYTCVAIGFMIPAEKFLKKMFGFDKASTPSPVGAMATGAAMSKALSNIKSRGNGDKQGGRNGGNSDEAADSQVRFQGNKNDFGNLGLNGAGGNGGASRGGLPSGANAQTSAESNSSQQAGGGYSSEGTGDKATDGGNARERLETGNTPEDIGENTSPDSIGGNNNNSIDSPNMSRWDAMKEMGKQGLKDAGSTAWRNIRNAPKTAWNNKGKAGRFIAKKGLGVLGAAALGTLGLGVGIATGDPSKAFQMAGLGAAAGMNAGGRLGNKLSDAGSKISKPLGQRYRDARWGVKASNERAARQKFLNDKNAIKDYQSRFANKGQRLNVSQAQEKMKEAWNYKRFGLSDDDAIKAMEFKEKMDASNNPKYNNMDKYALAAKAAEMSDYITQEKLNDDSKLDVVRNDLINRIGSEEGADQFLDVMNDYYYGIGNGGNKTTVDPANQEAERRRNYMEDQERQRKFKEHFEQRNGGEKMEQEELNKKMAEAYGYSKSGLDDNTVMKAMDFESNLNTSKDTVKQRKDNKSRARAMGKISQEKDSEKQKNGLYQYALDHNLSEKDARNELDIFNNGL